MRSIADYAHEAERLTVLARHATTRTLRTALCLRARRYRDIAAGIVQPTVEDEQGLDRLY
jgi:hypothetical protein